jgi:hypothetical protein
MPNDTSLSRSSETASLSRVPATVGRSLQNRSPTFTTVTKVNKGANNSPGLMTLFCNQGGVGGGWGGEFVLFSFGLCSNDYAH